MKSVHRHHLIHIHRSRQATYIFYHLQRHLSIAFSLFLSFIHFLPDILDIFHYVVQFILYIKEKAGLFLKDYCNFTQADIDSLENRDRTSVIALLTRRMFDEE